MQGKNVRADLSRICRILAAHGMIDLWGHASLRVPGSDLVLVTPRFTRKCLPRSITGDDVLVCDPAGRLLEGDGEVPPQFKVDLAVYRKSESHRACVFASPRTVLAAGIARYPLKPLTHMESMVAFGMSNWEADQLAESDASALELADLIVAGTATHQPGIGVWSAGKDIFDCLMTLYHLEYLAQANLILAGHETRTVAKEDSDKLWAQFSGHHHYVEFFTSLDPGPLPHPYPAFLDRHTCGRAQFEELKTAIAFSCRALWQRDTLVAFLEHISHRLPIDDRFLMSASRNFRDMTPDDMCLLDYQANWIDGPRPPNFKWFHAQLLAERKDAGAVVHTHDLYGRVYAQAQRPLVPCFRVGVDIATRNLPLYSRCDLIVDPDVRRQTLDALGDGPVVHEIGHGTDFVAQTLEEATVNAIQREAFLAMHHLAERFGQPRPLPATVLERLQTLESDPGDWWWFYAAEVGAPCRSAGGL